MISKQTSAAILVGALLAATGYGLFQTSRPPAVSPTRSPRVSSFGSADSALVIDQSSLTMAQELVRLPTTAEERQFAEDALRIGDQEMDLAFAQAVREVANQPRATTKRAQAIDARLQQAQKNLAADEAQIAALTPAVAKAPATTRDELNDRLELAKAQLALDQDEVDDAREDLIDAGGDPQGRMQSMIQEHNTASKASDSTRVIITAAPDNNGLIFRARAWEALRQKEDKLRLAKAAADSAATVFSKRHDLLDAQTAHPSDSTHAAAPSPAGTGREVAAALLRATQLRAVNEKAKATLDQRVGDQKRLSRVYTRWIRVVSAQRRTVVNRALRGLAVILAIVLLGLFVDKWIETILGKMRMDARRTQTAYLVTRVSLQVIGVLLILLVIFGPPDNLGTFLGLAGAGLTVALKDFIIGFCGWFVLMGKNGIRMGDLVEINGVTGEVVELGMFHTVLLETSGWSDSGHPTGRRVTFTNGFAIEDHYFNFSTSGQWGWDEVHVVVPDGRDPRPIIDALRTQVEAATVDSAREAEQQWKVARRSPHASTVTAAPAVNIKPIMGGTEITVRYITQVGERSQLRASLYQTAIDLLGERVPSLPAPGSTSMARG